MGVHACSAYHMLGEMLEPRADVDAGFGSNQQIKGLDVGAGAQQFLHEDFAQETSPARDENTALAVELGNGRFLHFAPLLLGRVGRVSNGCCNFQTLISRSPNKRSALVSLRTQRYISGTKSRTPAYQSLPSHVTFLHMSCAMKECETCSVPRRTRNGRNGEERRSDESRRGKQTRRSSGSVCLTLDMAGFVEFIEHANAMQCNATEWNGMEWTRWNRDTSNVG